MVVAKIEDKSSDSIKFRDIWLLPNLISVSRVLLTPVVIYFLSLGDKGILWASLLFIIIIISDWLDGFLSRKLNEVSALGVILDPIADKIVIAGMSIALVVYKGFPLWLLLTLLIKDFALLLGGVLLYKSTHTVSMANFWGKATTVSLAVLAGLHILNIQFLITTSIIVTLTFLAISTFYYVRYFFIHKKEKDNF